MENKKDNWKLNVESLNEDIKKFKDVYPITEDMTNSREGVSRMIMLDRYAYKDVHHETLKVGDMVVATIKPDPNYPTRAIGHVSDLSKTTADIRVLDEYAAQLPAENQDSKTITVPLGVVDKPLEIYYEQIAKRVARGLAEVEEDPDDGEYYKNKFYNAISNEEIVPAGRVLYGAGTSSDVTYFNCFVLPYPADSRDGLSLHRSLATEIMSRGGGVGTNGSTLRPKDAIARGVNGKSSGSVSWLNDLANLTHLIEQGGSRRGAQMIMMADWHPDVIEFIVSKVQNPYILRKIIKETKDPVIKRAATEKLKFEPLSDYERIAAETIVNCSTPNKPHYRKATSLLDDGGKYSVEEPDFLTGANISVAISDDFMKAVENDEDWTFIFPDTENYSTEEMEYYDAHWQAVGDARAWRDAGHGVKEYNTIRAKDLWKLINICATYSAEPGVFFMDRANEATNATAYGEKVVATNPCGEQPLAGMSVCNLSALNLSKFVDKGAHEVDFEKLAEATWIAIRLQDNIIDATPYFLAENETQAMGERRIGLGVMGLADMLIYANKRYGSEEGNELLNQVFETIAVESYRASIELAKEKGSFGFMQENPAGISTEEVRERFVNTGYTKTMPEKIKQDILKYGIRNSHTTTIAPTGSTGSMVNVSTGLEPYFAFKYYRSGRLGSFMEVNSPIVQEYLSEHSEATEDNLPDFFVTAMELSPEEHVSVQNTIQRWVDSSISKTVNMPRGSTPDEVAEVYIKLYNGGAKGGTVYVDGSRDTQVLSLAAEDNKSFDEDIDINKEELTEEEPQIDTMTDKKRVGTEVGDTCPVCRNGHVIDSGGCNTCDNCGAQLTCGL